MVKRGWKNEPGRHSLAARGIPTRVKMKSGHVHVSRMPPGYEVPKGKRDINQLDRHTQDALVMLKRSGQWNNFEGDLIVDTMLSYGELWCAARLEDEGVVTHGPKEYEVVVGNIGTVYRGTDKEEAEKMLAEYKQLSSKGYGKVGGEEVTLLANDGSDVIVSSVCIYPASKDPILMFQLQRVMDKTVPDESFWVKDQNGNDVLRLWWD